MQAVKNCHPYFGTSGQDLPELTNWTVGLNSVHDVKEADRYIIGDLMKLGWWSESQSSLVFEHSYSLRKSNILSPGDEGLDFKYELFSQDWLNAISEKDELEDDLECSRNRLD